MPEYTSSVEHHLARVTVGIRTHDTAVGNGLDETAAGIVDADNVVRMNDPEERVQHETEDQAEREPVDETTAREAFETELMDEDDSESGSDVGEHIE